MNTLPLRRLALHKPCMLRPGSEVLMTSLGCRRACETAEQEIHGA